MLGRDFASSAPDLSEHIGDTKVRWQYERNMRWPPRNPNAHTACRAAHLCADDSGTSIGCMYAAYGGSGMAMESLKQRRLKIDARGAEGFTWFARNMSGWCADSGAGPQLCTRSSR